MAKVEPNSLGRPVVLQSWNAGSATVGKSTLIKRYCESRFVQKYIPTIGIDYGVKPVRVLGHDLKVNFFDTSGAAFTAIPWCGNYLKLSTQATGSEGSGVA